MRMDEIIPNHKSYELNLGFAGGNLPGLFGVLPSFAPLLLSKNDHPTPCKIGLSPNSMFGSKGYTTALSCPLPHPNIPSKCLALYFEPPIFPKTGASSVRFPDTPPAFSE